ncbi:MAG: hypothetical protein HON90_06295 [Halobacteriovoraceae bacterium]|nr:hypothetical protein [Halobacteriovoraceae bacterium]
MKQLVTITFLFVFNFVAHADTAVVVKKVKDTTTTAKLRTGWGLGIGTQQLNYDLGSQGSETLNGFALIGSKDFTLPKNFATKTSLILGSASNKKSRSDYNTDTSYSNNIEISQNISYTIQKYGVAFKPFFSMGFGSGNYKQETDGLTAAARAELGIDALKTTAIYKSQTTSLGLQILLKNGLAPFLSYNTTRLFFSEETSYATKNGSKDRVSIRSSLDDLESQALTVGLMYLF